MDVQKLNKDTTPRDGRTVKYKVTGRAFVNGTLVEPGADVMGPPGLHGKSLKQIDPPLEQDVASAQGSSNPDSVVMSQEQMREIQQVMDQNRGIIAEMDRNLSEMERQLSAARAEAEGLRADLQRAVQRAEDAEAKLKAAESRLPSGKK